MKAFELNRRVLMSAAAGLAWAGSARGADEIRLGSVLDQTGPLALYGAAMGMAAALAVDEINRAGGLLGRPIRLLAYDTGSDLAAYPKLVEKLLTQDHVDVLIGGILSASREAIRPQLTAARTPYFYTLQYEGGVCDHNTVLTGLTPAQQAEVLVPYAMKQWGRRAYVLAADYNYGRYMAKWFQKYLKANGGRALGTEFFPLAASDFAAVISRIQEQRADFVISALVGTHQLAFVRQWVAAGMKSKIPLASSTFGVGNEQRQLSAAEGDGIVVAYNYSTELQNPANKAFLAAWAGKFGDTSAIQSLAFAHYQGVMLWAEAVRRAGSVKAQPLFKAIGQEIAIKGASGLMTLDPVTQHVTQDIHVMEVRRQKLLVKHSFSQLPPRDTQSVCDLKKDPRSSRQFELGD